MAIKGGKPQSVICKEFTFKELLELSIYKKIEFSENNKDDVRHASLMAMVGSVGGGKHSPQKYMPKWGSTISNKITKEQICQRSKNHWKSWIAASKRTKDNKKV